MYPVRLIKLMTGELLVAGISDSVNPKGDEGVYTLENPMNIYKVSDGVSKGKNGRPVNNIAIFFKPWIEFSDDQMYIIPKSSVLCVSIPDRLLMRDYNEALITFLDGGMESDDMDDVDDSGDDTEEGGEGEDFFGEGEEDGPSS